MMTRSAAPDDDSLDPETLDAARSIGLNVDAPQKWSETECRALLAELLRLADQEERAAGLLSDMLDAAHGGTR